MNQRQLEAFNAFMIYGSVTKAAQKLNISQPAVSRLLNALESSLGFALFEKKKNKLTPTQEARSLHKIVIRSLVGMDEIKNHAGAIATRQIGSISIGAQSVYVNSYLMDVVAEFKKRHPNVQITIHEEGMEHMLEKVNNRSCDIGIGVTLNMDFINTKVIPIAKCKAICIIPKGHELEDIEEVTFDHLKTQAFVDLVVGSPLRMRIDNLFYSNNWLKRNTVAEALNISTVCGLVERGVGIAIVDPFTMNFLDLEKVAVKSIIPVIEWQQAIFSAKGYEFNALENEFIKILKVKVEEIANQIAKHSLTVP